MKYRIVYTIDEFEQIIFLNDVQIVEIVVKELRELDNLRSFEIYEDNNIAWRTM